MVTQKAEHFNRVVTGGADLDSAATAGRGGDGGRRRRKLTGEQLGGEALETKPKANGFDIPTPW